MWVFMTCIIEIWPLVASLFGVCIHPSLCFGFSSCRKKYLDITNRSRILTLADPPSGSAIWNFLLQSRNIIISYITWVVHNGEEFNFWLDSWAGFPPLHSFVDFRFIANLASQIWRSKLIHYVEAVEIGSHRVIWKCFSSVPIPLVHQQAIDELLHQRHIFLSDMNAEIIWAASSTENYTIKRGYEAYLCTLIGFPKALSLLLEYCYFSQGDIYYF